MTIYDALQFVWPTLISAAAWAVAVWALQQPDEHSELVRRLTGTAPYDRNSQSAAPVKTREKPPRSAEKETSHV